MEKVEKARIFLVEDNELVRSCVAKYLMRSGYNVVLQAGNLKQALDAIEAGQLRELGVNVVIVDGNLGSSDSSCRDGFTVSKNIRETGLPIKIIAFSGTRADVAS